MMTRKALSLFSSAGIGDLGLRANGIQILASNELLKDRDALYQRNFPNTKCFLGDIWAQKDAIMDFMLTACRGDDLFMVYATPPCQGMSSNGFGRLRHEVRQGNRPPIDERNLSCCRFRGHRDRCFMEPEVGYGTTEIYTRVQA